MVSGAVSSEETLLHSLYFFDQKISLYFMLCSLGGHLGEQALFSRRASHCGIKSIPYTLYSYVPSSLGTREGWEKKRARNKMLFEAMACRLHVLCCSAPEKERMHDEG